MMPIRRGTNRGSAEPALALVAGTDDADKKGTTGDSSESTEVLAARTTNGTDSSQASAGKMTAVLYSSDHHHTSTW